MNDYYEDDMNDPDTKFVRPKDAKKSSSLSYCKWAAQEWEARYYAWTPEHRKSMEFTLNQLMNDPCWGTAKSRKIDARSIVKSNKARGEKKKR